MKTILNNLPSVEDILDNLSQPAALGLEFAFLLLTVSQVFVIYRVLLDVVPYPVFLTFCQLAQGLVMACLLGEAGKEFSRFSYFPQVTFSKPLMQQLALPTLAYVLMLATGNILLRKIGAISAYPVLVSIGVVVHHLARYIGCGEEYLMLRWKSIGIITGGFLIGCLDPNTAGSLVIVFAIGNAIASAVFRAGYLNKIMHVVEGRGNVLHNHQHLLGMLMLIPLIVICGETEVFLTLPYDISNLRTFQIYGCIVMCGVLPFVKNVVSNRLIKKTGQGPWRCLEILSILVIFLVGFLVSLRRPNIMGIAALIMVVIGRSLCAIDVKVNSQKAQDYQKAQNAAHPNSDNVYYQESP